MDNSTIDMIFYLWYCDITIIRFVRHTQFLEVILWTPSF